MRRFVTFILFLISVVASGQDAELPREYFDSEWELVHDPKAASYYRTVEEKKRLIVVKDYFISGVLEEFSELRVIDDVLVKDGKTVVYYPNGTLRREGVFKNDVPVGIHTTYYTNGKPRLVIRHDETKKIYMHFWSPAGEELLPNGSGLAIHELKNNRIDHDIIRDSMSVAHFLVNKLNNDTLYTVADTPPEYKGGLKAMSNAVGKTLKYPASARSRGIQGVTFVVFVVGKDGAVTEAGILRGFYDECDQEALRAAIAIANWEPAKMKGKNVRFLYTLPIKFKLGE